MDSKNKNQFILLALLFIFATLASQAESRLLQTSSLYDTHEQWMARYGRVYKDSVEKEKRADIFNANVEYIESFNKGNKPYKLGLNKFADLTNDEFKLRNGFRSHVYSTTASNSFGYDNVTDVPTTMDWRQEGAVTAIKDQGQCGE